MNVEFKVLDNGLTIVNDKMNINSTSIGVWIGSGSAKEKKMNLGLLICWSIWHLKEQLIEMQNK